MMSEDQDTVGTGVIVLSADLMDRSKISTALPDATIVRSVDKVLAQAGEVSTVLIDLHRIDDMDVLAQIVQGHQSARVIAFGSHVDEALLGAAAACGAEAMPRSLFFRRLADGAI